MSAGSVPAPAAPLVRVGPVWTFGFGLAWFGFWMANLVPIQLLLPIQLTILAPESKVWAFAVVNAVAGVVALVALPLFGVWSDRSRSRFGRRRAPIVFGAGVCAVGLVMAAQEQQGWVPLMLWWSVAILGLSAMAAGLTAVVADRIPEPQRGMISSAIYGPQALGVVVGLAAVVVFGLGVGGSYVLLAVALVGLSLPFVLGYQDRAAGATVLSLRDVGKSLLVDPRQHPDFAWAFAGRLLLTLANSFGTCYMLYFLTDRVRPADPEAMLLLLTGVYLVAGVVASVVFGFWSDRLGRRRPFAVAAALAQAVAGFLLIGATSTPALIVASVLSGGGFAAYLTINQAVVTRVLPDADNRATDLGLMNIGVLVPPAIAPLLASAVVTSGGSGYPVLFLITGLVALAATVATRLVRSVP